MTKFNDIKPVSFPQSLVIRADIIEPLIDGSVSQYCLDLTKKIFNISGNTDDLFSRKRAHILDIKNIPIHFSDRSEGASFIYIGSKKKEKSFAKSTGELFRLGVMSLIVLLFLNITNVYYRVVEKEKEVVVVAYQGFKELISGYPNALQANIETAQIDFDNALYNFETAKNTLWFLNSQKTDVLIHQSAADTAKRLIGSGKAIAEAGSLFTQAMGILDQEIQELNSAAFDKKEKSLTKRLKFDFFPLLQAMLEKINIASQQIRFIPLSMIPAANRVQFQAVREQLIAMITFAEKSLGYAPAILELLGDKYPQRYLLMFANTSEPRPGQGFWGSYALFDFNDGYIENLSMHDIYERDGLLHEEIEAPLEIQALSKGWRMRDSNYSSHFPLSAQKADWFLQKEKGPSVDGVISIDLAFAEKILELTGEIHLERFKQPLTKDNFTQLLQFIIESKIDGEKNPKIILSELIPKVQKKIIEAKKAAGLLSVFQQSIKEKHLIAYSKDEDIQDFFQFLGADGSIIHPLPKEDYLQVVYTAIGGNKSFGWVEEDLDHKTFIEKDGKIVDQLTITQKNTWNEEKQRMLKKLVAEFGYEGNIEDKTLDILGRSPSKLIARIYVPVGSTLEDVHGVGREEINLRYDHELKLSYFIVPIEAAAQETRSITIRYKLPFALAVNAAPLFQLGSDVVDTYSMRFQKRLGGDNILLKKEVILDPLLKIYRTNTDDVSDTDDTHYQEESVFKEDRYFSMVVGVK